MLQKVVAIIATVLAIGMSLVHLRQPLYPIDPWSIRLIHLGLGMAIVFLTFSVVKKRKIGVVDILLATIALVANGYILLFLDDIIARSNIPSTMDLVVGGTLIILVLEMTRRAVGLPMVIIAVVLLLYAYFGNYMPELVAHKGHSISRIIDIQSLFMEGIYGVPIGASASFVILFIIFGAFLQATKTGDFFMAVANSLVGRTKGGPAKIAVFVSAFFGTISGSSIANVVSTGAYTIPLMKRTGYSPHFAAGVEASASSGGQIMPPVMGAAAFVMSEMTGIPYITICLGALLPAVLYFASVQFAVHLEALKAGLKGLSKEEVPSLWQVLKDGGHLIVPLLVLIFLLAVMRFSPMYAAVWSIVASVVISSLRKRTRMTPKEFLRALEMGAKGALVVIAACACAGIFIGVINLTGLGLRFASILTEVGAGSLLVTLILTMATCYILGMGVPTTAAYIICAVLAAPALIHLGVPVLTAHLFVLYSAVLADITPPVAVAAFAAAGIAKADPMRTAVTAVRIGWMKFLVPYYFVYIPALIIVGYEPLAILQALIVTSLSALALSALLQKWLVKSLHYWEMIALLAAAAGFFHASLVTSIAAFVLLAIVFLSQTGKLRKMVQWRPSSSKKI